MTHANDSNSCELDRLRQENELLRKQLIKAQGLSALGELVGTTTHEFNNVLMTIINYAKLGIRNKEEAPRDKAFQRILIAAERANKITNAVLGVARNRSDQCHPTDLEKIVNETIYLLEREMQKYRVRIELETEAVPKAMAVGNQIQQILINLLTNARQAMKNGGQVNVRLYHDRVANTVDIAVRDFGTGISPDNLHRIFDQYYTTKTEADGSGKGGSGLGLSACRQIVEAHQGKIRVESTLGKGTSFTIKIPAVKVDSDAAVPPAARPIFGNSAPTTATEPNAV